ncbi:hypothetical protein FHR56_000452 [Xanthomonas sacchari]|uniref:hypothetical protein n=1 Tax=unclassified Xanthomonas TaxID=2643310 RepID=UPI00178FB302|nr:MULTISPECIES: hypothetical protein [unclassified Xanthomonas]MBB6365339.1 hypothetical protein [Xanthomonas sp. F10]
MRLLAFQCLWMALICTQVLASDAPRVSVEGMNKHSVATGMGLFLTRSQVATQGAAKSIHLQKRIVCSDRRIKVAFAKGLERAPERICRVASEALALVSAQSHVQNIAITLLVVPSLVNYQATFYRVGRGPKLVLIVPVLQSEEATLANVADLVAHEGFHVGMFAAGDVSLAGNEYAAYHYGLCGQLVALGHLEPSALPGFGVASDDPHLVDSSESAERVRTEVLQAFGDLPMTRESPAGEALLAQCRAMAPASSKH